jgi:hypothetical protein
MGAHGRKYVGLIVGGAAIALVAVAVANWQLVAFSVAVLFAEGRPVLLQDAKWHDEGSANAFHARFHAGIPEADLISWLKSNKFKIGAPGQAMREISSLPCNEIVQVKWSSASDHRLVGAAARVSEAGCL